jgi:hypothetical protein
MVQDSSAVWLIVKVTKKTKLIASGYRLDGQDMQ